MKAWAILFVGLVLLMALPQIVWQGLLIAFCVVSFAYAMLGIAVKKHQPLRPPWRGY